VSQIINFDLRDGGQIAVEAQGGGAPGGPKPVMRGSITDRMHQSAGDFENAVSVIHPVAAALIAKLKNLGEGTEAVDLKFGIKFNAEAGVVIASTSTEASVEISIKWRRPTASPGG
jgi:hypothetical protein